MYCIITTCSVECHWHCSEETVHYKSDEMVNFCSFRCATTSPITVFINLVFYVYISLRKWKFRRRLCQFWWKSIKKCDREGAYRRIHRLTDRLKPIL